MFEYGKELFFTPYNGKRSIKNENEKVNIYNRYKNNNN